MRFITCLIAAGLVSGAQGLQMGGPITGLVYDAPSKSVVQVLGIPGAARLSGPVIAEVDWATVAPDGRTAVVLSQGQARLLGTKEAVVEGLLAGAEHASWAADSASVVVYSTSNRALQWVRVREGIATAEAAIPLAGLDGEVTAMAADHATRNVVVALSRGGVWQISASGAVSPLLAEVDASAMAMEASGKKLWAADRLGGRILEVSGLGQEPATRVLIADGEKLGSVSALGLSTDGKRLYVASRTDQVLYQLDLGSAELSEGIALDAPASLMQPLGRPTLRLLGGRSKAGEPLYLLDENGGPGLYFVPAGEGN